MIQMTDEITQFVQKINQITDFGKNCQHIETARLFIKLLNQFLYNSYPNIGFVQMQLKERLPYFSDFHKYWEHHYKEILNLTIDENVCDEIAKAFHSIYLLSPSAFLNIYDTQDLSPRDICRIRMLTANQDFKGSLKFNKLADIFKTDPQIYDISHILSNPHRFLEEIKVIKMGQLDKREQFARNICLFIQKYGNNEPFDVIKFFDNDVIKFRTALENTEKAGYKAKKSNMLIRDMVVLNVWKNVKNFDKIDVASDVNTMKIALRSGLVQSSIPLISSFLDIFSYQYSYVDETTARAWRLVWKAWKRKYPDEVVGSPCLLDYFIYNILGKQFCSKNIYFYHCPNGHKLKWYSHKTYCDTCKTAGQENVKLILDNKILACIDPSYCKEAYKQLKMNKKNTLGFKISDCPLRPICSQNSFQRLSPPNSISIYGQTGWKNAYTDKESGGGGLKA